MSSDEFARLDRLDIRVSVGVHPGQSPDEVFVLNLSDLRTDLDAIDDLQILPELLKLTSGTDDGVGAAPYDLEVRKSHFSWGADGAAAEVLLYLSDQLASAGVGASAAIAVQAVYRRLLERLSRGQWDC